MTANPGGGDYRPDEPVCSVCGHGTTAPHAICAPCRVAEDAPDATETPAHTPGGSGTAEARTEAQSVRTTLYPLATLTPETAAAMAEDIGASPDSLFVDWINRGKELVALRAEVERLREKVVGYRAACNDDLNRAWNDVDLGGRRACDYVLQELDALAYPKESA